MNAIRWILALFLPIAAFAQTADTTPRTLSATNTDVIFVQTNSAGAAGQRFMRTITLSNLLENLKAFSNWPAGGGGGGDVTDSELVTASNALRTAFIANDTTTSNGVVSLLVANDTATSNALRTLFISNDTATSNGVISALMTVSNTLQNLLVANDTTTSNSLRTTFIANDTTTSNGVMSQLTLAASNRVQLVGGSGGITVSQTGSGGIQTWTINDDDVGSGGSADSRLPAMPYVCLPTSGIVGGNQLAYSTNLSADISLTVSNLIGTNRYYVQWFTTGQKVTFNNSGAWFFTDAGQGGYSESSTNAGLYELQVWKDDVSGRTNVLYHSREFRLVFGSGHSPSTNQISMDVTDNIDWSQVASTTNLVSATNALHAGKQATNAILGNIVGTGAITNLVSAGNTNTTEIALVDGGTNTTGKIKTASAGVGVLVLDRGTNLVVAVSDTNYSSSANLTVPAGSVIGTSAASGVVTNTLPSAASNPFGRVKIVKTDSSTNRVFIVPQSGDTISGMGRLALESQNGFVELYSFGGTNWIVAGASEPLFGGVINKELGLRKWRSDYAKLKSVTNTIGINVLFIGDSITEGYNSDLRHTNSFSGILRSRWSAVHGTNSTGYLAPWRTGSTYAPLNIITSGSWSSGSPATGAGGGPFAKTLWANGTNNYIEITNVVSDGFTIFYHENTFTATSTNYVYLVSATETNQIARIDAATSSTANYKSLDVVTNITTPTTIRIHAPAGSGDYFFFDGISLGRTNGIVVHNLGYNGQAIGNVNGGTDWTNNLRFASALSPSLVVLQMDSNDSSNGTSDTSYRTNLINAITVFRGIGASVLIVGSGTRTTAAAGTQDTIQAIEREVATSFGCAFFSLKEFWGDNSMQSALGVVTDGTHPTAIGHHDIANRLFNLLTP